MSDTVAVALIAVGGTLGSGLLSYLAARQSTRVQLKGVETEMDRLRETHAEEHRKERQAAYRETLVQIEKLRQLAHGMFGPPTEESYAETVAEFGSAHTNIAFIGSDEVVHAMNEMVAVVTRFSVVATEEGSEHLFERLEGAFQQCVEEWNATELSLIDAMKADVAAARRAEANGDH